VIWRAGCAILPKFVENNSSAPLSPLAMPCSILLRLLVGASGKVRKRYALIQKIMLLEESNRLQRECNLSIRRAAQVLVICFQHLARWHREVPQIQAAIAAERRIKEKKALLHGPASQLGSIEMELLQFVFAKCEQGINVALLQDKFEPKSFNANLLAVGRFMHKHKYVYRCAMNDSTCSLAKVGDEAKAFVEETCELLVGPHRDMQWVFNMDQTPSTSPIIRHIRSKKVVLGQSTSGSH
jgi:hypothetical protein